MKMRMNRRDFTITLIGAIGAMATPRAAGQARLSVNGERLNAHLAALAEFGKNPQGGVSRVAYSEADRQGRDYAMKLMREARLDVAIDAAGNITGRRNGSDANRAPLVIGSHIDSVPEGGNYDGDVGSLAAIEVAQTLAATPIASVITMSAVSAGLRRRLRRPRSM
jgi:N-carbamoyl-L-amino-acid hydrolase